MSVVINCFALRQYSRQVTNSRLWLIQSSNNISAVSEYGVSFPKKKKSNINEVNLPIQFREPPGLGQSCSLPLRSYTVDQAQQCSSQRDIPVEAYTQHSIILSRHTDGKGQSKAKCGLFIHIKVHTYDYHEWTVSLPFCFKVGLLL